MKIRFLFMTALAVVGLSLPFNNHAAIPLLHEKAIIFENDGQSVDAFEGTLMVPENRNNKNSRKIPLTYVRFPSTSESPSAPIIYLSGGPGGSGISTAQYPKFRFPLFMALREHGDVIALDQRGTGKSRVAPNCKSSQSIPTTSRITHEQVKQAMRKAANECVAFWYSQGVDVLGYNSLESAHDLNTLRKHLNAEKITLWGISYGSHLALSALKVMEPYIDKIVIASAEGLNQTVKLPAETDAYFERLQTAINQQPSAAKKYPDIKTMIARVHKRLEEKPVMLKIPTDNDQMSDFLFQKVHMQGMASAMIADPHRGLPKLLEIYWAIDNGITSMLPSIVKRAGFDRQTIDFDVMSFGMDVASGITEKRMNLVDKQAETSLLGYMLNFPMPHLNKSVKGLDLGDDFRQAPVSDVPTLLLSGTLDGRTYLPSQKAAVRGLSNVTHVVIENGGHNVFMLSPDITEAIKAFLGDKPLQKTHIHFALPPFVK
ncbi:alpha/beta hydrolase [Agaribacter flavus]|uniref:Alpha/beta hydrolase n=1 Tax=Agaribacter flavus TaxID=1902781 RepID=A0ABV7FTL7_9ALTE